MSTTLQDQLSNLPIPRLTTVLRVSFTLLDHDTSFASASRLVEAWWNAKGAPYEKSITRETEDLAFSRGRFSVDFARSEDILAISMQEPDSAEERDWLCDFALRREGGRSEVGLRLSYRQPQTAIFRPEPRAPRFLSDLINKVGAVDLRAMEAEPRPIDRHSLQSLTDLILSSNRTLPVIVISKELYSEKSFVDASRLSHLLAGTAHVYTIDGDASWDLSREWGSDLSVFQGAVRCYSTGFSPADDKFRHRLWLPETILRFDAQRKSGFLNACVGHVFTQVTAQFESRALISPAIIRRQIEERRRSSVTSTPEPTRGVEVDKTVDRLSAPDSQAITADVEAVIGGLQTTLKELTDKLERAQSDNANIEARLNGERAARAEAEKQRDELDEERKLLWDDNEDLRQKSEIISGNPSTETSPVLKPLFENLGHFVSSIQNVAIQFRRMEHETSSIDHLKDELREARQREAGLRAQLESLEAKKSTSTSAALSELVAIRQLVPEWRVEPSLASGLRLVASLFPERLVVLDSAHDSAISAENFKHKAKGFELIWKLATSYWEVIQTGGDMEARKVFGSAFASNEGEGMTKVGIANRTFIHNGNKVTMLKHLKIGNAWNDVDTLRIHFEWAPEEKQIIVGHCGGHLNR